MYADNEKKISEPKFEVAFGSIVGIKKNVCTMPIVNDAGSENGSQMSGNKSKKVKPPTQEINVLEQPEGSKAYDTGPEGSPLVFEIELADKILTLYTHDQESMDNFVHCILQILIFKVQILDR